MAKDKPIKQKNRKTNLLFHLSVLALAVVLNPPKAIDIASIGYYILTRVFPLGVFYTCYFWLVPDYLAKKKIVSFIFLLIILLNLVTVIGIYTIRTVHNIYFGTANTLFYNWKMHLSGLFAMIVAAIFGIAFRSITGWYEEIQKKTMLEKEKLQSELMLLKAQVNPHFLFNTLNTIDFLIYYDQSKASQSLIKLSSLLRYVIYETVNDQVPLQQELEHLETYIDLQRLRYREMASISYEKTGDPSGKMIVPMLFIPFVENAFKHTDEAGIQKGLTISFCIKENTVEFACRNYISQKENNPNGGFGLGNVKKRLEMQYPDRYTLSIEQTGQVFNVNLKLNLI